MGENKTIVDKIQKGSSLYFLSGDDNNNYSESDDSNSGYYNYDDSEYECDIGIKKGKCTNNFL